MTRNIRFISGLMIWCVATIGITSCNEKGVDGGNGGSGAHSPPSNGGNGATTGDNVNHCLNAVGDDGPGNNVLTGILLDSINTDDTLPGLKIEVLDNDTGDKVGINTVSETDGSFRIEGLDDGLVGLLVVATDADEAGQPRIDTRTFNVPSNAKDREIFSTQLSIADFVQNMLGFPDDPETTAVSGGVYYYDENCNEWPVGCATVAIEREGDLWYFDETRLPNPESTQTPSNGLWLLTQVEITDEKLTVTALIDGVPSGNISMPLMANKYSSDGVNATHITRVYVDKIGNPTPNCVTQ